MLKEMDHIRSFFRCQDARQSSRRPDMMRPICQPTHVLLFALLHCTPLILGSVVSPFQKPSFVSRCGDAWWTPAITRISRGGAAGGNSPDRVLIIDIDNCLYSEREVKASSPNALGIEEQIISRTHDFCKDHYNISERHSQELYFKYGSTVEGLRRTVCPRDMQGTRQMLKRYYNEVYDGIDMSGLLSRAAARRDDDGGTSGNGNGNDNGERLSDGEISNTGYSHIQAGRRKRQLAAILKSIPYPIYFASNSPKNHVLKVLTGLGLRDVPIAGIVTPDTVDREGDNDGEPFPTKSSPRLFYKSILGKHSGAEIVLLDDSLTNIRKASQVGIVGVQITSDVPLEMALAASLGHIESSLETSFKRGGRRKGSEGQYMYQFSDVDYLRAKNSVDAVSINVDVWQRLADELRSKVVPNLTDGVLRIADVGAGVLSMLEMMFVGGGGKPSLFGMIQKSADGPGPALRQIHYTAYESNLNLIQGCKDTLQRLGFSEVAEFVLGGRLEEIIFRGQVKANGDKGNGPPVSVTVHLRTKDFAKDDSKRFVPPNLVVGCCFADLFDPHELAQSLLSFTTLCKQGGGIGNDSAETLVYFPITFTGTTQFHPAQPFQVDSLCEERITPSDTHGFDLYSKSLSKNLGHNLDEGRIIEAIQGHGGSLLCRGKADWHIDPTENEYLWQTMMYFFGTCGAPEILSNRLDSQRWIQRAKQSKPSIQVSNSDLLFRLGGEKESEEQVEGGRGNTESAQRKHSKRHKTIEEIEFQAPRQVGKTMNTWDTAHDAHLGPNDVEVESICSLISSGTELKIFNGSFDEAQLDVNIKGMEDAQMAYPLAYGYSLVGRVTRCGSAVPDADELVGRLVFTFSPHSSHVIVDRNAVQLVPRGICAEDAIFMPSVETALSLVHDAHVRVGENVSVFGQGLIGLLVTGLLSLSTSAQSLPSAHFGTITAFDTITDRLAASSKMGASQALLPTEATKAGPFDVSIEVSGNARALQSAIDNTSSGGRIIVGSWYGNADVNLKLGIDFHRSHKTIKTSQVSEIPAELTALWSKERRFRLTWELVKALRPSRLITKSASLDEAQEAYEDLAKGEEIAVIFRYGGE